MNKRHAQKELRKLIAAIHDADDRDSLDDPDEEDERKLLSARLRRMEGDDLPDSLDPPPPELRALWKEQRRLLRRRVKW